jgi:hypothetical protein
MCAGPVGHTQASAQIVRIGHAIENQQKGLLAIRLQLFEQGVERAGLFNGLNPGHDTLMPVTATELGQAQTVRLNEPNPGLSRSLQKLTHAGVTTTGIDIHLEHGSGRGFDANANRMESEKGFGR